jgi:hypothetical protein
MRLFGESAFVVLLVPVAVILAFAVRRWLLGRGGGTVELSLRLRESTHGRGWVLGTGRFAGDELQWFRVFSLAPHPRRTLSRRSLTVVGRRVPSGPERLSLQAGMVVLECRSDGEPVQLAMGESALTGFLSWLESAAPGASIPG